MLRFLTTAVASIVMMHSLANPGFASKVPPKEAREIAKEAYVYGFPIVMHYKTMVA